MRYLKTSGGPLTLEKGTPFVILGDLNLVGSLRPLETLMSGNIVHEDIFGQDIKPDWDDSNLADAKPSHNNRGKDFYTWRWDGSSFPKSRIDYVLYSDSVMKVSHRFVLDTLSLQESERKACGLQKLDSAKSAVLNRVVYDHLPVIVDFQIQP